MVTDQCGRLIAFTCAELSAHTWAGVNSLPFGIGNSFTTAAVMMPSVPSDPIRRSRRS